MNDILYKFRDQLNLICLTNEIRLYRMIKEILANIIKMKSVIIFINLFRFLTY